METPAGTNAKVFWATNPNFLPRPVITQGLVMNIRIKRDLDRGELKINNDGDVTIRLVTRGGVVFATIKPGQWMILKVNFGEGAAF